MDGGTMSFHDFNCVGSGGSGNSGGFITTGNNAPTTPAKGKYHIYNCQFTNTIARAISPGFGDYFGLIDHCLFITRPGNNFTVISGGGNSYNSWTNMSNPLGTASVNMVENCVFINNSGPGNLGNGFYDGYQGCQMAYRWNWFNGPAANGWHGYDSDVNGMRTAELYHNVFTNFNNGSGSIGKNRAGTFQCFSNWVWGISPANFQSLAPSLQMYRGVAGAYQGTYSYAGFDLTNWWSTNYEAWGAEGYVVTNIWWYSRCYDTGYFNTYFTSVNATRVTPPTDGNGPKAGWIAVGSQPNYTYGTNLSNNLTRQIKYGTNMAETIINTASAINFNLQDAGVRWSQATTNYWYNLGKNPDYWCPYYGSNYIVLRPRMDSMTNTYRYPNAFQPGTITLISKFTNFWITFPQYSCSNVCYIDGVLQPNMLNWGRDYISNVGSNSFPNYIANEMAENRDFYNDTPPAYTTLHYPHPMNLGDPIGSSGISTISLPPPPPKNLTKRN
jgi:hypothetical protein